MLHEAEPSYKKKGQTLLALTIRYSSMRVSITLKMYPQMTFDATLSHSGSGLWNVMNHKVGKPLKKVMKTFVYSRVSDNKIVATLVWLNQALNQALNHWSGRLIGIRSF